MKKLNFVNDKKNLVYLINQLNQFINLNKYDFIDDYLGILNSMEDIEGLIALKSMDEKEFDYYEEMNHEYLHETINDIVEHEVDEAIYEFEESFISNLIEELEDIKSELDIFYSDEIEKLESVLGDLEEQQKWEDINELYDNHGEFQKDLEEAEEQRHINQMFNGLIKEIDN